MPEPKVDDTTDLNGKDTEAVDFEKEYQDEIAKVEKAERDRKGYAQRHQNKSEADAEDEDKVTKTAERILEKVLPRIESSAASLAIDAHLNQMTTDPALKKLIIHHFENSVSPSVGTIQDRLEYAQAIALKKVINKQASELNIAASNRSQISNLSMGQHGQSIAAPKDNDLSEGQIAALKARGFNDTMIEDFKKKLMKK